MEPFKELRKAKFWNKKILKWEEKRYFQTECSSLISRRDIALTKLSKVIEGNSIVELGCGSAYLANDLLESGASHYHGFDFSEAAIENALKNIKPEFHSKTTLKVVDINQLGELPKVDIVFSLGFLDWISLFEIQKIKTLSEHIPLQLHSFTKKTFSLKLLLHKVFVLFTYGLFNGLYTPRYYTTDNIINIFKLDELQLEEDGRLGIGAIINNWS
jgi:SAM-dependent methyltransferase